MQAKPTHVVGAAILDEDHCLVAQRGRGMDLPGKWEFPGGKVQPGEHPRDALAREVAEELQLSVEVGDWLGVGEAGGIVLHVYACRSASRAVSAREHAQTAWLNAEELPALDWAEADLPVIPAVQARLRGRSEDHVATREPVILSVDWGKDVRKRAACVAIPDGDWRLSFEARPPEGWRLGHLLHRARDLSVEHARPVLVGIDAVLGVPAAFARRLGQTSFAGVLELFGRSGALEALPQTGGVWSPEQPFFRVPPGEGGLSRMIEAAGGKGHVLRQIERRTGAKSVFVVSGIPGSVGSGSRALWSELTSERARSDLAPQIWPFDGTLAALTREPGVVVAEVYPRAAYGIVLAAELPAAIRPLGKTLPAVREDALAQLAEAAWWKDARVDLPDLGPARQSEDDFDALMTALALVRLLAERRPLSHELIDPAVEGGILGTGGVVLPSGGSARVPRRRRRAVQPPRPQVAGTTLRCPIPGCPKVYASGRLGWDAHVGSLARHPTWHPSIRDPEERKARFRREFADWF